MTKAAKVSALAGMTLIDDKASLFKAIDLWGNRAAKWAKDGHILAVSALAMSAKHNDIGPVNRMFTVMPNGVKRESMTSWLLAYGALVANTDSATKKDKPFVYTKDKEFKVEAAAGDPWYDHKPDKAPDEVFDVQKALMAIIKKAQGKELIHGELITAVQALLSDSETVATAGDGEDGAETIDDTNDALSGVSGE